MLQPVCGQWVCFTDSVSQKFVFFCSTHRVHREGQDEDHLVTAQCKRLLNRYSVAQRAVIIGNAVDKLGPAYVWNRAGRFQHPVIVLSNVLFVKIFRLSALGFGSYHQKLHRVCHKRREIQWVLSRRYTEGSVYIVQIQEGTLPDQISQPHIFLPLRILREKAPIAVGLSSRKGGQIGAAR